MKLNRRIQIAIDGPAGSGKSTVAKIIAKKMNIVYLDTGAMYRAVTYNALKAKINLEDDLALRKIVDHICIDFEQEKVLIDHQNCTDEIRTPEVTNHVSIVARNAYVRSQMVIRQREIAKGKSVVMDGRDIGTCVLPQADFKFFLIASAEERAKRRLADFEAKGHKMSLEKMITEIECRDKIDSEREVAPLKMATDAIKIDTTALNIEQVVNTILEYVH